MSAEKPPTSTATSTATTATTATESSERTLDEEPIAPTANQTTQRSTPVPAADAGRRPPATSRRASRRSRAALVALVIVGGAVGAYGGARAEPLITRHYTSTTSVLVVPTGAETILDPSGDNSVSAPTEALVATSDAVLSAAAGRIGQSLQWMRDNVSAVDVPNSTVIAISASDSSPKIAAQVATAVGAAYISQRHDAAAQSITGYVRDTDAFIRDALVPKIKRVRAQLARVSPRGTAGLSFKAQLSSLETQSTTLSTQLAAASTRALSDPRVIQPAVPPHSQDFPPSWAVVPALAVLGAAVGAGVWRLFGRRRRDVG